jgi:hypothetical protein
MKLLIPLYDLSYFPQVLRAIQRRKQDGKVAVIANVDSGPGVKVDPAWTNALRQLRVLGVEVFGYVDLVLWDKDGNETGLLSGAKCDDQCLNWLSWYKVAQFFYDDYRTTTTKHLTVPDICIANPGTNSLSICGFTVVHEAKNYLKSKVSLAKGQGVIAMGEKDYKPAMALARQRGVSYFYATDKSDSPGQWNAYDSLPSYFDQLVLAI